MISLQLNYLLRPRFLARSIGGFELQRRGRPIRQELFRLRSVRGGPLPFGRAPPLSTLSGRRRSRSGPEPSPSCRPSRSGRARCTRCRASTPVWPGASAVPPPGVEPVCPGAVAEFRRSRSRVFDHRSGAVAGVRERCRRRCRCCVVAVGAGTVASPGARRSLVAGISGLARLRPARRRDRAAAIAGGSGGLPRARRPGGLGGG